MIKRISRTKRIKEVKDLLSEVGMNFREDKDWNTFQVWPDGNKRGGLSTYDTLGTSDSDLEDALGTGLDMAKRIKKANPRKCRTFQVKRKVGKKTIQVRRKVCNPEKSKDNKLFDLLGEKVEVYFNKKLFHTGILGFNSIKQTYTIGSIFDPDYYFYTIEVVKIIKNKIYLQG